MTTLTTVTATDFVRDQWFRPLIMVDGKLVPYTRASSAAKTVEDTWNLEMWARRNVVFGMARDPSLVARAIALGGDPSTWDEAKKDAANKIHEAAADVALAHRAADIGTALHRMTEIVDRGEPLIAGPYEADIEAYVNSLIAAGFEVDPAYIECRLVCDELQMAGTADRILTRSSDRMRLIADLKTGETVDYGVLGWGAQLAAYAHSQLYDIDKGVRLPTPAIDRTTGIIVHLPAGKGVCTLYEIDLVAGYRAAQLANEIRAVRREARRWISPLTVAAPVAEAAARHPSANRRGELLARYHNLPAVGQAAFRDRHVDPDDLDAVEHALAEFETVADPEGGDRTDGWDELEARYLRLGQRLRTEWFSGLIAEAKRAGVGFHAHHRRSERRYRIYLGLITVAETIDEPCPDLDDVVRGLTAHALGSDAWLTPKIPVGKAVGSMNADEATRFADACALYIAGRMTADLSGPALRLVRS